MESGVQDTDDRSDGHRCPDCDTPAVTKWHETTFRYGEGDSAVDILVDLPVRVCGACGFEYIDQEGERRKHEALCRHFGVLTPHEIREIRSTRGMSRAAFAELTGLGEATIGRWERGAGIQSLANDRYLRLLGQANGVAHLSTLLRSSHAPEERPRPRFRSLVETKRVRVAQQSFELRKVA